VWHATMSQVVRRDLVRKFVKAIFPGFRHHVHDQRIKDLVNYACKVESEFFVLAESKGEYDRLLAEKIYRIQMELNEKARHKR
jgi:hypothetical protein